MEITDNPYRRRWISLSITEYNLPYILRRRCNLKNTKEVFLNVDVFFCIYDRTVSIYVVKVWIYATWRCTYRGADKSLARPGRKQATATKLGIYSIHSPRSSIHFLARYSNFCKPLKKKIRRLSVQSGLRGSNDLRVGRKMATSQLFFFSRVGLRTYQHPCITNETDGELPVGANQYNVTVSDHK